MTIHYANKGPDHYLTYCGLAVSADKATERASEVTCRRCRKTDDWHVAKFSEDLMLKRGTDAQREYDYDDPA